MFSETMLNGWWMYSYRKVCKHKVPIYSVRCFEAQLVAGVFCLHVVYCFLLFCSRDLCYLSKEGELVLLCHEQYSC